VFHFVRFSHIHNAFRRRFENLQRVLSGSAKRLRKRADDMKSTLSKPARADRYEKFGHLLMANAHTITRGLDLVTLPNILASGDEVDIPLDASLTAVENAQAYYDRARRSREARLHADRRLERAKMEATDAEMLLAELQDIEELRQLDVFEKTHASRLQAIRGNETGGQAKVPFRTYRVAGDLEVWVGRNARQNDQLTLRHARKFDIWMHARGVPGSHVVLRLPNRDYRVGREAIEQAAAIAAWWSDARPSAFAPVIFTERKFVRKPRGAHPGAVRVEREEVVMVEPGLPGDSQSEA